MSLLPYGSAPFKLSIGSTIAAATVGSVLFVGAGSVLAQNNSNLFWDNTNNQLKAASGFFFGEFIQTTSTPGVYIGGNAGGTVDSSRILFCDGVSAENWQIDNNAGNFRWFTPGVLQMKLVPSVGLSVNKGIIGNADVGNNDFQYIAQSGSTMIFAKSSTNRVGIGGTTSPTNTLTVSSGGTGLRVEGMYDESTTNPGLYMGLNTSDTTPRVGFANGTPAQLWQIDNNESSGGGFRWYTPGVVHMQLFRGTGLDISKSISVNSSNSSVDSVVRGSSDNALTYWSSSNNQVGMGTSTMVTGAKLTVSSSVAANTSFMSPLLTTLPSGGTLAVTGFSSAATSGAVTITGGQATGKANNAGAVTVSGGISVGGVAGQVDVTGGLSNGGTSGSVAIRAGIANLGATPGTVTIYKSDGTTQLIRGNNTGIGFFGATPVAQLTAYTITNDTTDRAYDANATTVDELADIMATLYRDLKSIGLFA